MNDKKKEKFWREQSETEEKRHSKFEKILEAGDVLFLKKFEKVLRHFLVSFLRL